MFYTLNPLCIVYINAGDYEKIKLLKSLVPRHKFQSNSHLGWFSWHTISQLFCNDKMHNFIICTIFSANLSKYLNSFAAFFLPILEHILTVQKKQTYQNLPVTASHDVN